MSTASKRVSLWLGSLCLLLAASGCDKAGFSVPQSPLLKYVERKSGKIVYAGRDGNIAVIDQAGAGERPLTTDARLEEDEAGSADPFAYYEMPLWSPDGSHVACVRLGGTGETIEEARIVVLPAGGGQAVTVFASASTVPDLVVWSPDSSRLGFLAPSKSGSSYGFYAVPASGGTATLLDAGYPYGFAWSARRDELVIHAGSASGGLASDRLAFLEAEPEVIEEGLGLTAGVFDTPAWSPDGRVVLVAAWEEGKNLLYATNRKRTEGVALAEVEGSLSFAFSPKGDRIAYVVSATDESSFSSSLQVIESPSGLDASSDRAKARLLSGKDTVAAFFWSPDGSRIAYFVPGVLAEDTDDEKSEDEGNEEPTLVLTLKVVDVGNGSSREVATFLPTPDFLDIVEQYPQYAQSLRIWSPDSRHVVYATVGEEGPDIMVAMAGEGIAPRRIAGGLSASWSRR